jgi:hypothetical protein
MPFSGVAMTNLFGRTKFYSFCLAAALLLVEQPAFADKRVALVIGNAAYQNVARLPNPVNDGATMAATLKDAGFDVVDSRHDLGAADTRRALRDFADRARDDIIKTTSALRERGRSLSDRVASHVGGGRTTLVCR